MRVTSRTLFIPLLGLYHSVKACEGECIVGVTNVFLGNYSGPIGTVFLNIVCIFLSYIYIMAENIL